MPEWIDVLAQDAVPTGRGRLVRAAGLEIALFSVDGCLHALEDSCPHAGASLAYGRLEGGSVTCPAHGLKFDVKTGCMRGNPGLRNRSFPVRVREGRVEIQVGEGDD